MQGHAGQAALLPLSASDKIALIGPQANITLAMVRAIHVAARAQPHCFVCVRGRGCFVLCVRGAGLFLCVHGAGLFCVHTGRACWPVVMP